MSRRRHLPPPALLEIDEQTFWEKYRPIVEPTEEQAIRDPEQVANLMAVTVVDQFQVVHINHHHREQLAVAA